MMISNSFQYFSQNHVTNTKVSLPDKLSHNMNVFAIVFEMAKFH